MRHRLMGLSVLLSGGLMLAGCVAPAPFDPSQVSLGIAQQKADYGSCDAKGRAGEITSYRQYTDCLVAAKTKFAGTIKLKQPGFLAAFTQRMNTMGDLADAGKVKDEEFQAEIRNTERDFNQQIIVAYRENQREQAEESAKLAAVGQGLSNAGAALQASTPQFVPSPPTNCISTVMGGRANGDNRGAVLATNCQ